VFPFSKIIISEEVVEFSWPYIWGVILTSIPTIVLGIFIVISISKKSSIYPSIGLSLIFALLLFSLVKFLLKINESRLLFRINPKGLTFSHAPSYDSYEIVWDAIDSIHIGDSYRNKRNPILFLINKKRSKCEAFQDNRISLLSLGVSPENFLLEYNYIGAKKDSIVQAFLRVIPDESKLHLFDNSVSLR